MLFIYMKDLPIYKMEINNEEDGVFAISCVESPAIESNFILFSKEEDKIIFSTNDDAQVITGPALIPDILIYRKDKNNFEYNITISKEVIKQTAIKFFKTNAQNNTTLDHQDQVEGTTYFESWIVEDPNNDKSNTLGFKDIPTGTWMVSMKVHDKELWSKIKDGEFNGFSIEGYFDKTLVEKTKMEQKTTTIMSKFIDKIKDFLNSLESEVKFMDHKLEDGTLIRVDHVTMEVSVINTDGSLTPLADGNYKLEDGTDFIVKDGKHQMDMVIEVTPEVQIEENTIEVEVEEVKAEIVDLILEDGTKIMVDMDTKMVTIEDGSILADGHYALVTGEEFDVVGGLMVIPEVEVEEAELSKIKLGLVKKDLTEELELKIRELELKITELENQPAVERTPLITEVSTDKMSLSERVSYNIKKKNGLI